MATLIQPSSLSEDDIVEITDIEFHSNKRTSSTIDFPSSGSEQTSSQNKNKAAQLKVTDELFGPLQIGPVSITRSALDALGATLAGQPLNGQNTFFRTPKRSFINALQFDPLLVAAHLKTFGSADDYLLPMLLFEMASRRPVTHAPMLRESPAVHSGPDDYHGKLDQLLKSAQKLDLRQAHLPTKAPHWINRVKSSSMASAGVGLQAFGIFSGLRGLQDALKNKDAYETVFNSAGIGTEVGSIGIEVAVTKRATQMIKAGQHALKDFARTRFAVRLGRAGGLIAGALTMPFDVIAAVSAFRAAASASAKDAVDYYVAAGLSVTSAAMTVLLGTAALAGFSFAGPVGMMAGLLLVAGSQIWGAIRAVDNIDDYIELTTLERLRTGWLAFWGMSPDKHIQDRHAIAQAAHDHSKMLQAASRKALAGTLGDSTEVIVNGHFDVGLKQVPARSYSWWTGKETIEIHDRPDINDGDDRINARNGVNLDTPGAVFGTSAEHKGVLWLIGGGNDTIVGVEKKPNEFHFAGGLKDLTGGEKDDVFVYRGGVELLNNGAQDSRFSTLKAGLGNDTLMFDGDLSTRTDKGYGFHVDMAAGLLSIIAKDSAADNGLKKTAHTLMDGFENVQTLAGAMNTVKATDGPNLIKSHGEDTIEAGAGDDQIYLLNGNGWVHGGAGRDNYAIAHLSGSITLVEDGADESFIALDWRLELIESWKIEQEQLLITSRFDRDDDSKKTVRIDKVYRATNNQRRLRNNKLTFITKDGFYLTPELPEIIETAESINIEIVVTRQGTLQYPSILYQSKCTVPADADTMYHVARLNDDMTLQVEKFSKQAITILHLDYASHELTAVETVYTARFTPESGAHYQSSIRCDQVLHFGNRMLTLRNLACSQTSGGADLKYRLNTAMTENHRFLLVMKDDVSYRVRRAPAPVDASIGEKFNGAELNRNWSTETPLPLPPRIGDFFYRSPRDNEAHSLGTWAKCVRILPIPQQTAIENLTGEGSRYLIHLGSETTLRISTPGALANADNGLPSASVWEFDATVLGEVDVRLFDNQLRIGSNIIHVPQYENTDDLVDQIRVITAGGVVHTVDLVFEVIYIDALDARYFSPPSDSSTALPEALMPVQHQTLKVLNAQLNNGTPGTLSFDLAQRVWVLDSDPSLALENDDIKTLNRCVHDRAAREKTVHDALNSVPVQ